jgi:hypothetical protein
MSDTIERDNNNGFWIFLLFILLWLTCHKIEKLEKDVHPDSSRQEQQEQSP